ncbi:MAG: acetate uptake transporter [Dehalococcoidia bacterium]|nr:acetate uptake transporter [Dehalococcoidia bacterium]
MVSEKLANPAPLGLAGFGITTLLLNVVNAEIVSKDAIGMVLPVGLFYGGLAQFMAGMWEAKKNNTFGFTAFSSYGAFWMAFAVMEILMINGALEPVSHEGLTVFLVAWGIFTTYMFIGTIRISVALMVVFAGLAILFYLLAWGQHNADVHKFAGYEGLFTAGAALYASAAGVINETWGRNLLPLGIIKK